MITIVLFLVYLLVGATIAHTTIKETKKDLNKRVTESDNPNALLEFQQSFRQVTSFVDESTAWKWSYIAITILWAPLYLYRLIMKIK